MASREQPTIPSTQIRQSIVTSSVDDWIGYTPTFYPKTGAFGSTSSVAGGYKLLGNNICFFWSWGTIVTNGTGAGGVRLGLPNATILDVISPFASQIPIVPVLAISPTNVRYACIGYMQPGFLGGYEVEFQKYDGTYAGVNNTIYITYGSFPYIVAPT